MNAKQDIRICGPDRAAKAACTPETDPRSKLDGEDSDGFDEPEDADGTGLDGEFVDDVHEPADELPYDCRVDYEPECADRTQKKSGD